MINYFYLRRNQNMIQQTGQATHISIQTSEADKSCLDYSQFRDYAGHLQPLDVSATTNNDPKRNSSRLDNLLYSSFVEIDRFVERQELTFNLQSAESFFKRSNNLFFSDFGKRQSQKMSHKKVQCQIGKASSLAENEAQVALLNKFKTLQVLKMVKLIKIIFKQLRTSIDTVKQEVYININQSRKQMAQYGTIFLDKISIIQRSLEQKCLRINELQRETESLNEENGRLKQELELQVTENKRLLKLITQQAEKSAFLINKLQDQKEQKIMECNEKIYSLQVNQSMLNQEISNLNDLVLENQRQFKKLQYEKKVLQDQYHDLLKRNQVLLKKNQENQISFTQQCVDNQRCEQEIAELTKLNELYLKQIESWKEEVQKVKEENKEIKQESQIYLAEQLQNLGGYFQEKYDQLLLTCNKNSYQVQNNINTFKNQTSQRQNLEKNKEKRKISVLSFSQNVKLQKKQHVNQSPPVSLNSSLESEKQNKTNWNLGSKRFQKHLSQQIKEIVILQNRQKSVSSTISSSDYTQSENSLLMKAKQGYRQEIRLSKFVIKHNESSKSQSLNMNQNSQNKLFQQQSLVKK